MTRDLDAILRPHVPVHEVDGWRYRNRPGVWAPDGVMIHHTAARSSLRIIVDGRPDLPGPLANLHIPKSGGVNLVSWGRCNHAGAGAASVLADVQRDRAPTGDALQRGLIDGPNGNAYFFGFECENLGDGIDPWPPEQLETIAKAAAAICRHFGWTANRCIGHREWSRRKIDPRGFSMASMRARIASLLLDQEDDDVPLAPDEAADLKAIKNYTVLATEQQAEDAQRQERIIALLEQIAAKSPG